MGGRFEHGNECSGSIIFCDILEDLHKWRLRNNSKVEIVYHNT
jgi:hypothetical protein